MNPKIQFLITCLWLVICAANAADKWSRQLEATGPGSETYDWIPVAQPVDAKERAGRVITYQQNFPPNTAFGELPKLHHTPLQQQVQPFGFPFHYQRFAQPQTQALNSQPLHTQSQLNQQQSIQQQKISLQPQPTSQSYFKFEMPFNRDINRNQDNPSSIQTGYQIQHSSFGSPQSLLQSPLFTQKQVFPPEFHPIQRPQQSLLQQPAKPIQQNVIEDPAKQIFRDSNSVPSPSQNSLNPTSAPQTFPIQQNFDVPKPGSFQSQLPFHTPLATAPASAPPNTQQDQEVQLLYVPYDTLYNQQRNENPVFDNSKYNLGPNVQQVNPYQINNFYTPENLQLQNANPYTTSTTLRPTTSTLKPTTPFLNYFSQQLTTPKPKPKAHQPPLAMFLLKTSQRPTQVDVVNALQNAKTIAVLDAPTLQAPNVFVGPAGMQTPNGYAKFELPYLSQIAQNSNLGDISFFVAPLSYRTPAGFNKILLPEPHVGSIVVNRQRETHIGIKPTNQPTHSLAQQSDIYSNFRESNQHRETYSNIRESNPNPQSQNIYITPTQNEIQPFPNTTPRIRLETTQRIKSTTPREYYPEINREVPKLERGRFPYEITTQRPLTGPNRGHKFSEISTQKNYFPEAIQEVTSPKVYKQERVKPTYQQNRPDQSQAVRPYAQFKPIPNNIPGEDFFKVQPVKANPSTSSTSTPTTTTTSTTTSTAPPRYFTQTYPTSPQIEFQSTRGQVYHGHDANKERFTTRPSIQQQKPLDHQQASDEEYRMKQYFRHQDAFRNRPSFPLTTPSPTVENVPYTPVSIDYDREVRIPSSTPTYFTTTTSRPVTQRQRVTFYHPTPTTPLYEENSNTVPPSEQVFEFPRDRDTEKKQPPQEVIIGQSERTPVPGNHRPNFSSSNSNNKNNEISTQDTSEVEFEPNPYQLPSELPPLTPNLPGLVNGLIEKDRLNGSEGETTIQMEATTRPTAATRPTRRPINRIKKPVVSKVSQSVSYSSTDYSTRRPINRVRRPLIGRNYTASSTSTTEKPPTSSRSPIIRNPNRIRYNPTPEERQTLRLKTRKHGAGGKKTENNDDLEYQRDVLKQNYPVFKPSTKRTTTTPMPPPADGPTAQPQQIYTVTPSTEQSFDSLIEPMQIAQQYQEYPQNNYGPGYFPNEEEIIPTEAVLKNEISPVYSTTTTTEEPQPTTRRSPFIKRGPRIRTTTESPSTTVAPTSAPNDERYTIRTRAPPRRIVKVRARTRRPHPASTTTQAPDVAEAEPEKNNYHRLNRFNQDLYQDEIAQRRQRIKSQFHLEPQESQWSPSLSEKAANNFQPLSQKEKSPVSKNLEDEPEIVTASPETEKPDSYVFNVSAGFGPTANTHSVSKLTNQKSMDSLQKNEKSFADLLEEVMSDIGKQSEVKSTEGTYFESQKTDVRLNRRSKWKNANSNPGESFETAESQNIGAQFFNSLYTGTMEKSTESMVNLEEAYTTTPSKELIPTITPSSTIETESDTDSITIISTPESEVTTKPSVEPVPSSSLENMPLDSEPESITRRVDDLWNVEDLESQPSVFSEVRKQLNELFTAEDDHEVDQEQAASIQPHKYEYTNIQRVRATPESITSVDVDSTVEASRKGNANIFHKNLMESVVYATSTSTKEDGSETEICYRGRCIRSEDLPPNHKLH